MTPIRREHRRIVRRLWPVAAIGAVLAVATLLPAGATAAAAGAPPGRTAPVTPTAVRDTPTQVIDAQAEPDAAAKALDAGCADLNAQGDPVNCTWHTSGTITVGYGPPQIIGDVLYNCTSDPEDIAETAVSVKDELEETTSVTEKVAVKIQAGIAELAGSSLEFEAFSKQAQSFSTSVEVENAVSVKPGWLGYTTTEMLSANITGQTDITTPSAQIDVTNMLVTVPGYQTAQDRTDGQVVYSGVSAPMTQADISSRCDAVNDNPGSGLGVVESKGNVRRKVATGRFKLTLCRPNLSTTATRSGRSDAGCATRKVIGPPPPRIGGATATLSARGRTYAAGTDTGSGIRLTVQRPIKAGKYTLRLRARVRVGPRRGHTQLAYRTVTVPIRIP